VVNNLDCDDSDALINPQKIWFQDKDGDGLGTHTVTTTSCLQPEGFVDNFEDLGDETKYITNIAPVPFFFDADGDGYGDPNKEELYSYAPPNYYVTGEDCNDNDIRIHPMTIWYYDGDGDGYGATSPSFLGCSPPPKYVLNKADLDDTNVLITDIPGRFFYRDKDGDYYGVDDDKRFQSHAPEGYVPNGGDCNDFNANLHPATVWYEDKDRDGYGGAVAYLGCLEIGNVTRDHGDINDNTDRITNIPPRYFYEDRDQDNDGNPKVSYFGSHAPEGFVNNKLDCDDNDPSLHHRTYWYFDSDGDGFGDPENTLQQCLQPPGNYKDNGWDYDDSTILITNIAPQYFYLDNDRDGYGTDANRVFVSHPPENYENKGGDCDDTDPLLHPETQWFQDFDQDGFGSDNFVVDCEPQSGFVLNSNDWDDNEACITDVFPRDFYIDNDNDGYGDPEVHLSCSYLPEEGYVVNDEDCDDTNDAVKPTTLWYLDEDGDGYGVETDVLEQCNMPEGYAYKKGDCDDQDPYLLPSAFAAAVAMGLDPYNQVILRDCSAPDDAEEEEQQNQEDLEGLVFADRDADSFGDPNEAYTIEEIDVLDFLIVTNRDDACPEKFGLYKGCPSPIIVETQLGSMNNQVVRLFVKDSVVPPEKILEKLTQEQLADVQVTPNPTSGLLMAMWQENVVGAVKEIRILGYHYGIEFSIPYQGNIDSVTINLTEHPDDLYFVQFYLMDGRFVTKKIIKAKQ